MTLHCRITKIDIERFQVELTSKTSDLVDEDNKWKYVGVVVVIVAIRHAFHGCFVRHCGPVHCYTKHVVFAVISYVHCPLPFSIHRLRCDDCLEDMRENFIRTVVCCVVYNCCAQ